ncbi:MAG: bacteriohemerythrin [Solirubrobacterales bacterium]
MLISWDAERSLGWDRVDHGQQIVIEMINQLNRADRDDGVAAAAFAVLDRYLVEQFAAEESLLAARRSPALAAHADEHAALWSQLAELRQAASAGTDVRSSLLIALVAFLGVHLRGTDLRDLAYDVPEVMAA